MKKLSELQLDDVLLVQVNEGDSDENLVVMEKYFLADTIEEAQYGTCDKPYRAWIANGYYEHIGAGNIFSMLQWIHRDETEKGVAHLLSKNWAYDVFEDVKKNGAMDAFLRALNWASKINGVYEKGEEVELYEKAE